IPHAPRPRACIVTTARSAGRKIQHSRAGIAFRLFRTVLRRTRLFAPKRCITKGMGKRTENVSGATKLD
ncbi:hypothetical protein, partial [Burkholderia contaminans]|uniref:hypothetical protein n=1 Tax=Burkholderia contaminans TaxID=488447 RepID=UPI001C7D7B5D